MMADGDTIVAISTPAGVGARGIVRLSGPDAVAAVEGPFEPDPGEPALSRLRYGASRGRFVVGRAGVAAPATVFVMRAPRSYTGEDQTELHLPGSPALLEIAVELMRRAGARTAEPGEFTRRAFLGGRLDLTQAEAVASVIHATTEEERRAALTVLDGELGRLLRGFSDRVLRILTPLELALDFSDQDIEIVAPTALVEDLTRLEEDLRVHLTRRPHAARLTGRPRLLLMGRANAGKSALFNALTGGDDALVSPVAGTTRDYLEADIDLDGRPVTLVDTAGVDHESSAVDTAAHRLREREEARADAVVLVQDGRDAAPPPATARPVAARVLTHADHVPSGTRRDDDALWVASPSGEGVEAVRLALSRRLAGEGGSGTALIVTNQRQRDGLQRAARAVERGRDAAAEGLGFELVAADLHEALACLRELTGEDYTDQLLSAIMRDFCIGK